MNDFDALWDFNDPGGTEARLRELLPGLDGQQSSERYAELLTQIARAQGLQQKFDDALSTLSEADAVITPGMKTARVRSVLERGRVMNSSKKRPESVPVFKEALNLATLAGLEFYAVDAAHMLGIVTEGEESLKWNEEAIRLSEAATTPKARRWLGSLYNNTGWTYFDMRRYEDALRMFEKDIAFRQQAGAKHEWGIARWSAAKVLRHLGRVEDALTVQMELLALPELQGGTNEGYTREEIAECLLLLGRQSEAAPQFAQAWELLRNDPWLTRDEPDRLARLKQLGK